MALLKQVIQFKDGEQVAIFNSAKEAGESLNVSRSTISKCCKGQIKKVKGFTFQYTGESNRKVVDDSKFPYQCPYCGKGFDSYNGLCKHVFRYKQHGDITPEQLLTDMKYGGVRPVCKCGCGQYTDICYEGEAHFRDFVRGHQSRVNNNWGHNPKAIENSAETRRQQYLSGERKIWNKGKTWDETYTKEQINNLLSVYNDEERNRKITEKLKGVPKSKEHVEAMKQTFNQPKYKEFYRQQMHDRIVNGEFHLNSKMEDEFIESCIVPLGIDFERQHYIKEIRHYCDVYIPEKNMVIEFNGDYWHANPKKYLRESLSPYQLTKVEKDNVLRKFCNENGIKLVEVWESEYKKSRHEIRTLLKNKISEAQE